MAVIAKGDASIIINAQETEAKLLFVPNAGGLGWDAGAVIKLAGENRLSPPPSSKTLEPFLQKAARAKGPVEMTLYEGIPPEDPVDESAVWEELPVPQDMAPFVEETLAKAGGPELYRIKTEKIKQERIVKKPNKLPFLPPREEVEVTWEKREIREAAEVNPEVKETRYGERDALAGTLFPPKPGRPGKTVFGRPIPPAQRGDGTFLLGRGLRRAKNEIRLEYAGIIRIGEHWADVVPLAKPRWEAASGIDGVTLFLNFFCGDSRFPVPSAAEILASLEGADASALIGPEELDAVIKEAVKAGEDILAYPLYKTREAEAQVRISADQLKAELFLRKGIAGARSLEMKAISQAINESGVKGFDVEKLKAAVRDFMQGTGTELIYPLAEGKPSTRGQDKEVSLLLPGLSEEERGPLLERLGKLPAVFDGALPLEELTALVPAEQGARIARITAPAEGEPGKNVFGETLPGLPGNDPDLKLFQGLNQRGTEIVADTSGLVLIKAAEKSFWAGLIECRDSRITVHIAGDAMEASADLVREQGPGKPLSREGILAALAEAGVVEGIDLQAVDAALRLAQTRGSAESQVLARGEAPAAAGSLSVRWLVPVKQDPAGNMLKGQRIPVTQGAVLAELTRLAGDRPGFNVTGGVPQNAVPAGLQYDASVKEVSMEGGCGRLVAVRAGDLSFNGEILSISALRSIKGDVGRDTGNINFSGEIRIGGEIHPGFTVAGGKDVLVGGSAEEALVSSGGRAVIVRGIRGGGKGVVRARSTIEAAFADRATLMAVEDIKVKEGCALCNIKTNGKLLISGERGRLIGGVCKARYGVEAGEIGSGRRTMTEISFGQDYLVRDQIEAAEREIEKIKAALIEVEKQTQVSARIPVALAAARAEKVRLMKLREQVNLKVFTLREKFEEHFESAVLVRGTVHPGVVMESHDRYYEVTQKRQGVVFYFDRESGRIKDRPLE
ncbi:MAG: FapA family protein [Treponema sp.]|jgi:uncharacterized protein (DUF342 family)|nr:FapA family protein [Treponema sp.]